MIAGDQAKVSVLVEVPIETAFQIFNEEIDRWWRRGVAYRVVGRETQRGVIHLEGKVGGRLFESFESPRGERIVETGRVTVWEPPSRLVFEWRAVNFTKDEKTEVEVVFAPSPSGTLVTVTHRGFSALRPDHPVRHGDDATAFVRKMGMCWGALMTRVSRARISPMSFGFDRRRRTSGNGAPRHCGIAWRQSFSRPRAQNAK